MAFYAFRLNSLDIVNQRSSHDDMDDDLVTFQVLVNDVAYGEGAITYPDIRSGELVSLNNQPPTTRRHISPYWIAGPVEAKPTDSIRVVYTGTNQGDLRSEPDQTDQNKLETKALDVYYAAMIGVAAEGLGVAVIGAAFEAASADIGKVLDFLGKGSDVVGSIVPVIEDPVGTALGKDGFPDCNGLVFLGETRFTGDELSRLPYGPQSPVLMSLPGGSEWQNQPVELTDQAAHDTGKCGLVARTKVSFSVIRIDTVSLRNYAPLTFAQGGASIASGLRPFVAGDQPHSLRKLLRLTV
jgi:hypothetical protein